ncbi:MAG: DUF2188 domain-containing protein [Verrucomicrobiae bacterium]|nr:DUF2188 domain-containing protein [Verrucomicrobiae bacterium]
MKRTIIEVKPSRGGGWEAKMRGNGERIIINNNKARVISAARQIARDLGHSQLIVKKADGHIQTESTYK